MSQLQNHCKRLLALYQLLGESSLASDQILPDHRCQQAQQASHKLDDDFDHDSLTLR